MLKKVFSIFLVVCLLCGAVIPSTVISAQTNYSTTAYNTSNNKATPVYNDIALTYEATGINGDAYAVNSGFVTVNVYLNVISDTAHIWGLNLDMKYNDNLTLVSVKGCVLNQAFSTPLDIANSTHNVMIAQDMGFSDDKTFEKGKYLLASLTFKVDNNFHSGEVAIEIISTTSKFDCLSANKPTVDYGIGVSIYVDMLGDLNNDGEINALDLVKMYAKILSLQNDYSAIYDMNTDGKINLLDLVRLKTSI